MMLPSKPRVLLHYKYLSATVRKDLSVRPCVQGFAWLEINADQKRMEDWMGEALVPLQFVEGLDPKSIQAAGVLTESEAIVLKAEMEIGSPVKQEVEKGETVEASARSPAQREEDKSTFAAVLDSIEQAIETAAVAVETMAGGVTSPRDLSQGLEGLQSEQTPESA